MTPDLLGMHCQLRDSALVAWAVSFASDYHDISTVNIDKVRASKIEEARVHEQARREILARIPGRHINPDPVEARAMTYLGAMMDKRGSDYTQGLRRPFPADALEQGQKALGVK